MPDPMMSHPDAASTLATPTGVPARPSTPVTDPGTDLAWSALLARLMQGERLSESEAHQMLEVVFDGAVPAPIIAGVLVLLRQREESVEELLGFARAMGSHMVAVPVNGEILDTCGTGGDRQGTINVSTAAGLLASAAGARVLKHGGRAASSKTGSADVLEQLGINVGLDAAEVAHMVETTGFGFALATRFHPAMAAVAPIRRALGIPTAFNFLGPLVNPGRARYQLVGVFDRSLAPTMANVLLALGSQHALIVSGDDGMDEVSLTAPTRVWEVRAGHEVDSYVIEPNDYGFEPTNLAMLQGGDAKENANILHDILHGRICDARRDLVAFNAGAALYAADLVTTIAEGVDRAILTLTSGRAGAYLDDLVARQPG
ncbi:anthranilate phosphoribosyltransferase [Ferrimicrobium sp.]|uniref:anthranilate phosphoribosyltransferase n=1 Tax=Ferrimicrobium sp. TaxID=2926050 RepID=UPI002611D780|nr:anthranilate phosphoribosyltransferase [Ferrimicrobium sp.]